MLLNRGGRVIERGPDTVRLEIAGAFERHGVAADVRLVAGAELRDEAVQARDDVLAGGLDAVVVGGGDGSVGCVAGVLADSAVPLGVLPLGTLNHFAKDLGMPLDLPDAVAAIAGASQRAVDVGEINGTVFVNNAVLGVYPFMVSDRERRRREHGLGKWVAMGLALARMAGKFPRRRLKLKIAGDEHRYRTPCLFVGVNEYHLSGLELRRRSGMDKGELWFLVARHERAVGFLWFALRSAFRGLDEAGDFDLHRASSAVVRPQSSRMPVAYDGEAEIMTAPLRFRVRAGALLVLAPEAGRPGQPGTSDLK